MHIGRFHELVALLPKYLGANPVIVEAGAFNGSDTLRLKKLFPKAVIYAFEPVPSLYEWLERKTKDISGIHTYPYALSNISGSTLMWIAHKRSNPDIPSQASSLRVPLERLNDEVMQFSYTIEVLTITLDDWADKYAIKKVDFLWLDIQGMELAVMQAAPCMMKNVLAALVEVSFKEGYKGEPLKKEVCAWMQSQGFDIVACDFDPKKETANAFFGNILFAKKR